MLIVTAVSWAGHDFSYAPGDTVDVADDVGAARIAAGLADPADPAEPAPVKRGPGRPRKS